MAHRFLDHSADVALELTAPSQVELFIEAMRGLTDTMTSLERVAALVGARVDIEAPDLECLLVDWLNELIYQFESRGLLFSAGAIEIESMAVGWRLVGRVEGEPFDAGRHGLKTLVKSATFHQLRLDGDRNGWSARVVLDL